MEQNIFSVDSGAVEKINAILRKIHSEKVLLVCDGAFSFLPVSKEIERLVVPYAVFSSFTPNPVYEDMCRGVEVFNREKCDTVLAIGGGSAMDVAKCVKLYNRMDGSRNYLEQEIIPNRTEIIAVPTTAGTGSESTRFAVIYYKGEKQSISDESLIPKYVILCSELLQTLPDYHRKATMLDALCHGIESFWSVNSTRESRDYSEKAVRMILEHMNAYLGNTEDGNRNMLVASNFAGKAINLTQTTAGHAMCYKLTSIYGIAHGHAAALCLPKIWNYMLHHIDDCIDPRGQDYLKSTFEELSFILTGEKGLFAGCDQFNSILSGLDLSVPVLTSEEELQVLAKSVNPVRLKNNPVRLSEDVLKGLYREILG